MGAGTSVGLQITCASIHACSAPVKTIALYTPAGTQPSAPPLSAQGISYYYYLLSTGTGARAVGQPVSESVFSPLKILHRWSFEGSAKLLFEGKLLTQPDVIWRRVDMNTTCFWPKHVSLTAAPPDGFLVSRHYMYMRISLFYMRIVFSSL